MSVFLLNFACLSSISPNFIFLGKITFQSYTPSQCANKLVIVTIFRIRLRIRKLAWISKYPPFANIATILKLPLIDDARIHGCHRRAAFFHPFWAYYHSFLADLLFQSLLASICAFAFSLAYSNLSIILFVPNSDSLSHICLVSMYTRSIILIGSIIYLRSSHWPISSHNALRHIAMVIRFAFSFFANS